MIKRNVLIDTTSERIVNAVIDRIHSERSMTIIIRDIPNDREPKSGKDDGNEPSAEKPTDSDHLREDVWKTEASRKYLIGKQYCDAKASHGGDRTGTIRGRTRTIIAEANNCSDGYVKRSAEYARGIDFLEDIYPGSRDLILHHKKCINEEDICAVGLATPVNRMRVVNELHINDMIGSLLAHET